jgi:hypothetical protein
MKKLITAILLALTSSCAPPSAYAGGMLYVAPNYTVSLLNEPCTAKSVLQHVPPEHHKRLFEAMLVWKGKPYEACWFRHPDGTPYLIDQDGEAGALLQQFGEFQPLMEAGSDR